MQPLHNPDNSSFFSVFAILLFIVPAVFFILTQHNTLRAIRRENRLMRPGLVWLQFIPFFGQVWQFIVVSRISGSAVRERLTFMDDTVLGVSNAATAAIGTNPTLVMGMIYCTLEVINILFLFTTLTSATQAIQSAVALAQTVCWIIYWVQLSRLKIQLTHPLP